MSDYISREALIGKAEKHYCDPCKGQGGDLGGDWCRSCVINSVLEKVRGIPAADVKPVRHGAWYPCFEDWQQQQEGNKCSVCGFEYYGTGIRSFHYCPNCGAKMDLI